VVTGKLRFHIGHEKLNIALLRQYMNNKYKFYTILGNDMKKNGSILLSATEKLAQAKLTI